MTTFRQVVPNSVWNPNNARFEFYLVWLSVEGGVRNWLFSHTDGDEEQRYDNFVIEGIDNIRSVPSMERRSVTAITRSMDQETFDYVRSIMASNRVYCVDSTGVKTPIALKEGAVDQANKLKEFNLRIKFSFQEENVLNV